MFDILPIESNNHVNSIENPSKEKIENAYQIILKSRLETPKQVIASYLNINSVRNKFDDLKYLIGQNVDVLCLGETKVDDSFPQKQFILNGYKTPYRLDISANSGGLLTYVSEHIPSRKLHVHSIPNDLQIMAIELNLRKQKWLLLPIYRPPRTNKSYFLDELGKVIDNYSKNLHNIIAIGDFNLTVDDPKMREFMKNYNLYNLIKTPTCFKGKPNCIDLILTNRKYNFQNSKSFETGLSDWHHMIYTKMKTTFVKLPPKQLSYRCYKTFNEDNFLRDLDINLNDAQIIDFSSFEKVHETTLEKHAPLKTRYIRGNEKPHLSKEQRKGIMLRAKLKNIANRTKDSEDIARFKQQRNNCVKINRKNKRKYYETLNTKTIDNSRKFYKVFSPLLSNKGTNSADRIILVENNTIISDDKEVSECFSNYFTHITDTLDIREWPTTESIESTPDPVYKAISKYTLHPSIKKIREVTTKDTFAFRHVLPEDVHAQISKLQTSRSARGSIPIKIIKLASKVNINVLTDCLNNAINNKIFPDSLKLADITPAFKKVDSTLKDNYRAISILSALSKVYERLLSVQMNEYIENKISSQLCGFRKGYSTQYALINLIEKWRKCLDNKGVVGTVLMDLSKAFDCLPHDLLIAKLDAYGFSKDSLDLIFDYLSNRKQRVKVGCSYSTWQRVLMGVPQGSVLGPLLFNIFINDLFMFNPELCNFADDNTVYACEESLDKVVIKLEHDIQQALLWFRNNSLLANPSKFQLMFLGLQGKHNLCIEIDGMIVKEGKTVKLLGLTIDSKLTFRPHIDQMCKLARNKTNALRRIVNFISEENAVSLCNTYFFSAFTYCPLIWMFCFKESNNKINNIQERTLKILHGKNDLTFDELLTKYKLVKNHVKNLRSLMIEIYKAQKKISPKFMWDLISHKDTLHDLRSSNLIVIPPINSKTHGSRSFTFRGSVLWNTLPDKVKNTSSLAVFKSKIKLWMGEKCQCKLCLH